MTKTVPPHTTGDELPTSGNATRQRTFLSLLQVVGNFVSGLMPSWDGPRHEGQFPAVAKVTEQAPTRTSASIRFIVSEGSRTDGLVENGSS